MKQKGFTLVELLVVISIIGILTALVTANLTGLQARGRDAQRKAALESIRTGLEKYYDDNNTYPLPGTGNGQLNINNTTEFSFTPSSGTKTTYINTLPRDPQNTATQQFKYCVSPETSTGSGIRLTYRLFANLENNNDRDRFCRSTGWALSTTTCEDEIRAANWTCSPGTTDLTNYDYMVREP